jgi:uncharacterized protein
LNAVLGRVAGAVERLPAVALLVLSVVTLVLGAFASQQEADTDMTAFAPESGLAEAHARVADEFGDAGASIQVIVDAGPEGDVLSPEGLQTAQRITEVVQRTAELAPHLDEPPPGAPAVITYALPFVAGLAEQGLDPATVDEQTLDQLAAAMLGDPQTVMQAGALLSDDLDASTGGARAGLVVVPLEGGVSTGEQASAELALRDALADEDFGGLAVTPFGENIFADELLGEMEAEMPVLLGLAFLLIIGILFVTYRRVSDVLLGLGGLVITIVWTYGIAVLLGPSYLGITGVMSQISIMIPVLLVGLAIDFAIHLTSRYREDLAAGLAPAGAARESVASVGGALVLATITTMVGFLTNVVSPLPPMRDFGLFVAGGVLSAFIVMLLLVPAARSLLDRRRAAKGTLKLAPTGAQRGLGRAMGRAAVLAERHPVVTLAVAAVVTVTAGIAGTQVSTTFDQSDFVPEDSSIGELLATMQALFGGDLDETTNVLLDGDLATSEAANAMLAAEARMADTPNVRTAAGRPQVDSPASVIAMLAAEPELAEPLAVLGFTDGDFAPDADVAAMYDLARQAAPQLVAGVLTDDDRTARLTVSTTAGQDEAANLREGLLEDVAPLQEAGLETTIVSENLMFDEALDALTDSQTRGIIITLVVALLVLVGFYGLRERRPLLGVITMIPSALVVAWVAGSMWVLGLSFNVMTAMVASLAIGIGVPYGIHITNRFTEDLGRSPSVDEAIRHTVVHTGGALVGSATTTAAGFGVLAFASLAPMRQFGIITALTIVYSLIAAVLIEPACLKLWAQRRWRLDGERPAGELSAQRVEPAHSS